jgi:hypothetical protein
MTDWSSTNEKAADPAACMLAQNDLIMPGTPFDRSALEKAVTEGETEKSADPALRPAAAAPCGTGPPRPGRRRRRSGSRRRQKSLTTDKEDTHP